MTNIDALRMGRALHHGAIAFMLFAVLQVIDLLTTAYALAHPGFREMNAAMAWPIANLGAIGWAFPKIAVLGFTALAAPSIPRWSFVIIVLISAAAVANNVFCLVRTGGT
jgi:uncharacterized protein DUF5658